MQYRCHWPHVATEIQINYNKIKPNIQFFNRTHHILSVQVSTRGWRLPQWMAQIRTISATAESSTGRRCSRAGRSLALSTKVKESGAVGLRGKAAPKHFMDVKAQERGRERKSRLQTIEDLCQSRLKTV